MGGSITVKRGGPGWRAMEGKTAGLLGLLLVATALAGCAGGEGTNGSDGFSVSEPKDPVTEPFVFKATVSADQYKWDMGDGRSPQEGKTVEYVYGFTDGTVKVTLTATTDGVAEKFPRTLTLGTGLNAKPSFGLGVDTDWAVAGEEVRFQGTGTDADGDPLLFAWHCVFKTELAKAGPDHHGDGGGVPFAGGETSMIPVQVAEGGLPAPDRVVEGDFCANVKGDGHYSEDAVVGGSFEKPGLYRVYVLARDPKSESVSGFYDLVVSTPEDKPEPAFSERFEGTFTVGANGTAQGVGGTADPEGTFDHAAHSFTLEIPANDLYVNVTFDSTNPLSAVSTSVYKGNSVVAAGGAQVAVEDPTKLAAGSYRVEVTLNAGVQVEYTIELSGTYDMDPLKVFEPPH